MLRLYCRNLWGTKRMKDSINNRFKRWYATWPGLNIDPAVAISGLMFGIGLIITLLLEWAFYG